MSTSSDITEIAFSSSEVVIGRLEEEMLIVEEGGRRPRSWQTVLLVVAGGRNG